MTKLFRSNFFPQWQSFVCSILPLLSPVAEAEQRGSEGHDGRADREPHVGGRAALPGRARLHAHDLVGALHHRPRHVLPVAGAGRRVARRTRRHAASRARQRRRRTENQDPPGIETTIATCFPLRRGERIQQC